MLTVQPIVENAVKHAIALHPSGGTVAIRIVPDGTERVRIEVSDTGSGGVRKTSGSSEIGLANVRRRVELHFGSSATVEGRFAPEGGIVTLGLPIKGRPLQTLAT